MTRQRIVMEEPGSGRNVVFNGDERARMESSGYVYLRDYEPVMAVEGPPRIEPEAPSATTPDAPDSKAVTGESLPAPMKQPARSTRARRK